MSRIDNLEQRVTDLERNVGSAMGELGLVTVSTRKGSDNYREGCKNPIKMINSGAFSIRKTKVAFVINETPIYEYDETAIYDLHIAHTLAYIWHSTMYVAGGVIRAMTVADVKKFFEENPSFAKHLNLVQDINHMSDLYLIP